MLDFDRLDEVIGPPALLAMLADPQWPPYLVFPGEFVAAEVLHAYLEVFTCTT